MYPEPGEWRSTIDVSGELHRNPLTAAVDLRPTITHHGAAPRGDSPDATMEGTLMSSTFTARFDTLPKILAHSTDAFRDRPLFGVKKAGTWGWMTHGAFREEVDRVRTGLATLGIGAGDAVALISDNRPEWAITAYAAYGLGASVVPMYEAQHDDNWRYILSDSGATVAFVADDAIRERVRGFQDELGKLEHVIAFDAGPEASGPSFAGLGANAAEIVPMADVEADDVAGFVYTSGTTGRPKGVVLSHGNLARNVSAITDVFPIDEDDRTLSFLPWAHAFGQTVELHTLVAVGASTAFAEATDKIVANLGEVRPTMLVSVPRVFTRIYDGLNKRMDDEGGVTKLLFDTAVSTARTSRLLDLRHGLLDRIVLSKVRERFGGNLKYAISGGAAIPVEVARFIDALGITVYEGYGLSETSPIATANWPGNRRIGSVGKAIPGVTVTLDSAASEDPRDGEIVVHGHNVMQGYHNLPDKTAEVMTDDGGFRTGDLGRLDDDGFLYITGRVKEQYKLANGKYVVPTIIEDKLSLSPYIANAMVHGDGQPYNVALVVADIDAVEDWARAAGRSLDPDDVPNDPDVLELIGHEITQLTSDLPRYEQIRQFALLDEDFTTDNGLLTPTLKLRRPIVLDRFGDTLAKLYG
jgi:long-chain acyl-CoA synthetase